jgi:hypothetical protein
MSSNSCDHDATLEAVHILRSALASDDTLSPSMKESLAYYVVYDFDRICENDEDYEFRIRRCVREFVRCYCERGERNHPTLHGSVLCAVKLCEDWFGKDEYSHNVAQMLAMWPRL